jgi:hypothetical protein
MDVAGAKALKRRLAQHGAREAPPAAGNVDVPADAPPVYRWTGVSKAPNETPSGTAEDEIATVRASFFRRLGLSFR